MLLTDALNTHAAQSNTRSAYRFLGKETSFMEFRKSIGRLSFLYQKEVGYQQRVAFLCSNTPAMLTAFFAFTNNRCLSIPLNPSLPDEELAHWLKDAKATHLAVSGDLLNRARELMRSNGLNLPIVEIEKKRGGEYDTTFVAAPDKTPADSDPVLLLQTNGGVSGKKRGVLFNHKQIQHASVSLKRHYRLMPTDKLFTTMSWAHPFAFFHAFLFPMLAGHTIVIHHGIENKELFDYWLDSKVTRLIDTPIFFQRTLLVCKEIQWTLPGIKSISIGVGTLPVAVRKVYELLKIKTCQVYGQTENGWTLGMEEYDLTKADELTHGCGLPGLKYKVLDQNGDEQPLKGGPKEGPLAVMGPSVMSSYYLPNEKEVDQMNKQSLRGTWLYTGDVVRLSEDEGSFKMTWLGRKDDLIQLEGGQYIIPGVLDQPLKSISGVDDAAGFVLTNAKNKKILVAAVVKNPQATAVSEAAILETLRTLVTDAYEVTAIIFADSIPRDVGGNVLRNKLTRQFTGVIQ